MNVVIFHLIHVFSILARRPTFAHQMQPKNNLPVSDPALSIFVNRQIKRSLKMRAHA